MIKGSEMRIDYEPVSVERLIKAAKSLKKDVSAICLQRREKLKGYRQCTGCPVADSHGYALCNPDYDDICRNLDGIKEAAENDSLHDRKRR